MFGSIFYSSDPNIKIVHLNILQMDLFNNSLSASDKSKRTCNELYDNIKGSPQISSNCLNDVVMVWPDVTNGYQMGRFCFCCTTFSKLRMPNRVLAEWPYFLNRIHNNSQQLVHPHIVNSNTHHTITASNYKLYERGYTL